MTISLWRLSNRITEVNACFGFSLGLKKTNYMIIPNKNTVRRQCSVADRLNQRFQNCAPPGPGVFLQGSALRHRILRSLKINLNLTTTTTKMFTIISITKIKYIFLYYSLKLFWFLLIFIYLSCYDLERVPEKTLVQKERREPKQFGNRWVKLMLSVKCIKRVKYKGYF